VTPFPVFDTKKKCALFGDSISASSCPRSSADHSIAMQVKEVGSGALQRQLREKLIEAARRRELSAELWKAKNASHISTTPTTTTAVRYIYSHSCPKQEFQRNN
jgi:selenocysteine lyase/cysteine desulfurase